ncbi:MAG: leucyl aminopeptidase family protein [Pseudomonadota bacterium]
MTPAPTFSTATDAVPLHVLEADGLSTWKEKAAPEQVNWAETSGFTGALGQKCLLPGAQGQLEGVLLGWGDAKARARGRFPLASYAAYLPKGDYRLENMPLGFDASLEALGWLMSDYSFTDYAGSPKTIAKLVAPEGVDAARAEAIAAGVTLTRDLINIPAGDMTPTALEGAVAALAERFSAALKVTRGEDLITQNFPMIHAVGRAASEAPRLMDLVWGDPTHPKITLVGKGIVFDTGGLNLKPGGSMGTMKKDMGGAANAIGLAHVVMALGLPVRLRLLVPCAENAIGPGAMRPGDILRSRKGLSVEINNTDAEGRLVLADALALADEEAPAHLFCFATLTGAARVATGFDLPPFFCTDDRLAGALSAASARVADPLWRLPFWEAYEGLIEPGIADLDNAPKGGRAGAITAALFLRRFVEDAGSFTHFDIAGWQESTAPARPKGGAAQTIRAVLDVLEGLG